MTNNKQQTAVGWFWNQLPEILPFTVDTETAVKLQEGYKQAKEMEKQQIIEAFDFGDYCVDLPEGGWKQKYDSPEKYYEQTYGGGEQ
jgi:hypothetical protein